MRGSGGHSMPSVGPRGKDHCRSLGATPPEAECFFQYVITKNSILEHENVISASQRALYLDQTFTWSFQNCIKNVILVLKNKVFAKVHNHLTTTVRSSPKLRILLNNRDATGLL